MLPAINVFYRCSRTGSVVFKTTYTSSACFLKNNKKFSAQNFFFFVLVAIKLLHSEQLTVKMHLSSPAYWQFFCQSSQVKLGNVYMRYLYISFTRLIISETDVFADGLSLSK